MLRWTSALAIFFMVLLPALEAAAEDEGASLTVQVDGIQSERKGEIGIALFENKKGFPTHLEHAYEPAWIPAQAGVNSVSHTFEGLGWGDYAVSVLHDENGNRKLERSTFGFPQEGVGFSNDQKVRLKAPHFDDCRFVLEDRENKNITIALDYRED